MTPKQHRKLTAYHEAGHAVIARVLTLPAGRATIKPNYAEGEAGHAIIPDGYCCESEWDRRGKVRHPDATWHAQIMAFMAGAEAEAELLGSTPIGDDNDRYRVALLAEELSPGTDWNKVERRLRALTRMLVRRYKARIERAAKALLTKTTLSAKALDKLVGRSVEDVKVNAPFLLAMVQLDQKA